MSGYLGRMSIADIQNMTREERIEAMEHLWNSLAAESDMDPLEWHREILDKRVSLMNSDEAQFISLDEAKERLRR